MATKLNAPTKLCGVVVVALVVEVHIAKYCRCTQVARLILTPGILQIGDAIGYTLKYRGEVLAIGGIHRGHLGGNTQGKVVTHEAMLVANHLVKLEVIGIRALKVDSLRCCLQVAEGCYITTYGKAL